MEYTLVMDERVGDRMDIEPLLDKISEYLSEDKHGIVADAYSFALAAHGDQLRQSGIRSSRTPSRLR